MRPQVSLYVDGKHVGVRHGVTFVANKKCPLRQGLDLVSDP